MARTLSNIVVKATLTAIVNNAIDSGATTAKTAQCAQGKELSVGSNGLTALANGTSANQADMVWGDEARALASAATENLDVYDLAAFDIGAGAGKDAVGQAWAAVEIVGFLIHNRPTSTGDLIIGGEGSGAAWNSPFNASDTAKLGPLGPGGFALYFDPTNPALAVADSTNHLLKFEASGGDLTYDVFLIGRSA